MCMNCRSEIGYGEVGYDEVGYSEMGTAQDRDYSLSGANMSDSIGIQSEGGSGSITA